jgi:Family of unknown function (DUF6519)
MNGDMRGDFSQIRFTPRKNYTSVLQQQGRVALDADANEQCLINEYIRNTETKDVVGPYGGPKEDEGFEITLDSTTNPQQILIGSGRYYVHGLLCENKQDSLQYTEQEFLINPTATDAELLSELSQGSISVIQVYLEVWRRLVTALDDPCLAEPALGQADTTARLQTVWRVVAEIPTPVPLAGTVAVTNGSATVIGTGTSFTTALNVGQQIVFASDTTQTTYTISSIASDTSLTLSSNYAGATTASTAASVIATSGGDCCCDAIPMPGAKGPRGTLNATTGGDSGECSCQPTPAAGYRGLENQLYRVEIHQGGDETTATFKWSRENGFVVVAVTSISGSKVSVDSLGPDANLGFSVGQWVEITDDSYEFGQVPNQPGGLYQIQSISPETLTVTMTLPVLESVDLTMNPRLRRWDQFGSSAGSTGVGLSAGLWLGLENGIQVQFGSGQYNSGDYWLIPARTATGQIEWPPCDSDGNPNQPAHRVEVYRVPLSYIEWDSSNNQAVVHDCRASFSPLTEVDLRFHNKHLHGWGIVCGLQVNCGGDRTQVTVKRGYAIDCDGSDVLMKCDASVSLVAQAQAQSLLDSNGDGDVSLILDSDGSFTVEQEDPSKESLASYFQNTIWVDFWEQCVEPLVSFFSSQFTTGPGPGNLPVGPGQQRIDTFTNLLYQLANTNGQYVFVSPEENQILSDLYTGLKQVLESRTFCGLFDNARPFPQYPFASLNIHSIFGGGNHARIRVHPNGTVAYTVSGPFPLVPTAGDNMIHVYDLQKMVMAAEVPFPGSSAAVVQDVAFSPDGTQLYAIALLGSNSVFAVATIQGFNLNWTASSINIPSSTNTLSGAQLVTLAVTAGTSPSEPNVWAVAQGQPAAAGQPGGGGLYWITPGGVLPSNPAVQLNAAGAPPPWLFGHLVIGSDGNAYMTANSGSTSGSYNCVYAVNLSSLDNSPSITIIPLTDSSGNARTGTTGDDIAIAIDPQGRFNKLYVVVDPLSAGANTQLLDYSSIVAAGIPNQAQNTVDLGQSTPISLAFNPANSYLLLGYANNNWVGVLDPSSDTLSNYQSQELQCAVPTELSPQNIALGPWVQDPSSQTVYVLNVANSTISTIPATMLVPSTPGEVTLSELATYFNVERTPATAAELDEVSLSELATYRNDVLNAFSDLLGVFLEDLKDCFCDRLLVNCPHCDGDDQLYLGCIQIRNSQVYRICNLSRRRYVKTFPTVGYWLSIVPILPVLKWMVAKFCCAVLPDYFSKFQAGAATTDRLTSNQIVSAKSYIQQINLGSLAGSLLSKLSTSGKLATDSISAAIFNPKPAAAAQINQSEVVGQQVQVVSQRLATAKIVVDSVQPYDPTAAATNVAAFLGAPTSLPAGSHVVLYEQNGVVRYYTLAPKLSPAVQNLTTQVQTQQATLTSLQQSQQVIAAQQQTIAAHELEITSLKTSLSAVEQAQAARDLEFTTLKNQVQTLLKTPPER